MSRNKLKQIQEVENFENVFGEGSKMRGKWREYFGNDNPVVLELACGHGHYAIEMGRRFPRKNFIGMDKKGDRVWNGSVNASEAGLKNVAFVRCLIEDLCEYFAEGEVSEIWITFPDPHSKPCKHKQRLTSKRFLDLYKKVLKPGGVVHLKTDNVKLFEYSVETVEADGWHIEELICDVHGQKNIPELLTILTYYERKFMASSPINYMRFRP